MPTERLGLQHLGNRTRTAKHLLAGLVIIASFYYVVRQLGEGLTSLPYGAIKIDFVLMSISFGLTVMCAVLGGWEWYVLLRGLGVVIGLRRALRVHLLAILPKYAPGFAWQLLGKAYLCKEANIPTSATALSMAGEMMIILSSGFAIVLITLPYADLPGGNEALAWILQLPLPAMAMAYSLIVPLILQRIVGSKMVERMFGTRIIFSYRRMLFVFVAVGLTWGLLGFAFFLLVASLYPVPTSQFSSLAFSLTVSFLVSLLAFFAPAGLGVREGILTFLLSLWLPAPVSAMVAILSRLMLAIGETLVFVVALRL